MEFKGYTIELNRTQLYFIPTFDHGDNSNPSPGTVVQVRVRGDERDGDISNIFSAEQASITRTIETLLVGHVNAVYKLPERVIIKEVVPGYILKGARKPWKYGLGKKFFHGDNALQSAEDKWIFRFEKRE